MSVERIPITDRASWLEMRKTLLTASDIAAAAGKDPWKTPLRLYNLKLGLVPEDPDNDLMRRGRHFEAAAIEYLRERLPGSVITQPRIFLADTLSRLGATPDALITTPGASGAVNCQIKTVARPTWEKWDGEPPLGYQLQTLTEGLLLDAEANMLCALVVSANDAHIETYDLPRNPTVERQIREIAKEFWRRIDNRDPYPVDYKRDGDLLAAMFPQSVKEPVRDLSGDNHLPELLIERTGLVEANKSNTARIETIDTEIKAKMGEAEVAELPGWRIHWKTQTRPEHVVREVTFRAFRVNQLKDRTT
jgi:putative phage-type endonuclease